MSSVHFIPLSVPQDLKLSTEMCRIYSLYHSLHHYKYHTFLHCKKEVQETSHFFACAVENRSTVLSDAVSVLPCRIGAWKTEGPFWSHNAMRCVVYTWWTLVAMETHNALCFLVWFTYDGNSIAFHWIRSFGSAHKLKSTFLVPKWLIAMFFF